MCCHALQVQTVLHANAEFRKMIGGHD
eukprot:SAG11_NODE_15957_length_561_cov_1.329004_1_plen_26_part_01